MPQFAIHEASMLQTDLTGGGRSILVALFVTGLALVVWRLSDLVLLAFGGVLVAVLLRHLAVLLSRWMPLPVGASLAVVVLGLALLTGAFVISVGPRVASQFDQLWQSLPQAVTSVRQYASRYGWARDLLETGGQPRVGTLFNLATGLAGTVFSALTDALMVLVVALFLAADPAPYRRGLLHLVPAAGRRRGGEVLDALGRGLWNWIIGQSVAMLCVGAITAIGLLILGIPLALALGIIAGLLNFIPYLGPILSGVPAVLIAFTQSPGDALNTLLLFVLIQNIEGYVLTPMLQRRAVSIPPALGIVAIVGLGSLFGIYGVLFGTPLLLVIMILVWMLYVEDSLNSVSRSDHAGETQ
jgi:predicted PurR-regulated permease PerM